MNVAIAIPSLSAMLVRPHVGLYAAEQLAKIDSRSQKDVDAVFIRHLDDPDSYYQVRALSNLKSRVPPKRLIQFLYSNDLSLRESSIEALKKNSRVLEVARRGAPKLESCGVPGLVPNCYAKPCEIVSDFDADKVFDIAQLVSRGVKGQKGIAFLFGSGRCVVIGAGIEFSAGGDDFGWLNYWYLNLNPHGKGTAIVVGEEGTAGGLIYWQNEKFHWEQWGD